MGAVAVLGGAVVLSPGVEAQGTAQVRVAHMAPGAPNVDVLVDGQPAFRNLAFGAATAYAPVPAGTRDVRVTPAGDNQNAVITAQLPVQASQSYTVVAVGQLPNLAAVPVPDDNSPPPSGQAKVRVFHAAPDVQAVDVAVTGGPVLFSNVAPRTASNYQAVDAGTYNLEVRPTGTQNAALRIPNVALQPGQIITVFATGLAADNSLRAVPVVYSGGGQGGAGAGGLPSTGTGGPLLADTAVTATMLAGLAAAAVLVMGMGTLVAARRRGR